MNDIRRDTIGDLDLRRPVLVGGTTSVRETIERLRAARLGCAVVVDAEGLPIGTFTEAVVVRALAAGEDFADDPVQAHLAPGWTCVKRSQPIADLVQAMEWNDLRFAVVVDETGQPVGLTGQKGLMEYLAESYPREVCVQNVGRTRYGAASREGA